MLLFNYYKGITEGKKMSPHIIYLFASPAHKNSSVRRKNYVKHWTIKAVIEHFQNL